MSEERLHRGSRSQTALLWPHRTSWRYENPLENATYYVGEHTRLRERRLLAESSIADGAIINLADSIRSPYHGTQIGDWG